MNSELRPSLARGSIAPAPRRRPCDRCGAALQAAILFATVDRRQRDHQDSEADREPGRRTGPERRRRVDRRPPGGVEAERPPVPRRQAPSSACSRRSARGSRAAAISAPTAPPANTNAGPRKQREDGEVAERPHVPLQPERPARRSPAPRARSAWPSRTPRRSPRRPHTRAEVVRVRAPRRVPATAIAGPMMLRMSTRNRVTG